MLTETALEDILILALDDSKTQLMHLTYILESMGFKVIAFQNPLIALDYLNKKGSILPDVILSDITMPYIDGCEFCRRVKLNSDIKHIPLIFITSLSSELDQCKGLDSGAVDYITKPYNEQLVKKRILVHYELDRHKKHLLNRISSKTNELALGDN
jgi:PleD family two-component response regulator